MLSPSSILDDSILSYMYITPGLDPQNFNIKTSNSCRQTESKFIFYLEWRDGCGDVDLPAHGIYKGVCLYIDVFRGPTYVPMYTYTHIGPDNKN